MSSRIATQALMAGARNALARNAVARSTIQTSARRAFHGQPRTQAAYPAYYRHLFTEFGSTFVIYVSGFTVIFGWPFVAKAYIKKTGYML